MHHTASGVSRRLRRPVGAAVAVAVALAVVTGGCSAQALYDAACGGTLVTETTGTVASPLLTEVSGLAPSQGIIWAHNDSGHPAQVFAMTREGAHFGSYRVTGADSRDWEDMGLGPGPLVDRTYLYAADIGDNAVARTSVQVYRALEPVVDLSAPPGDDVPLAADRLTFTYPDGPHNAEAFFVDPTSGELWIITKEASGVARLFRAAANLAGGSTTVLAAEGSISLGAQNLVTSADIAPDGDLIAVRTYGQVRLYWRSPGQSVAAALGGAACLSAVTARPGGEAVGFDADSRSYFTINEGTNPAVDHYRL